ncbi:MAG: acetate--CoA ligase family protein [Candidatus Nanohaloarchaea archaeon]
MALENLFTPGKIAVVGASREDGKTGHEVFENLIHGFDGEVVPVNPNADEVSGEEALDETPEDADLVVVVVPAKLVPDILRDAGEKGIGAAVVISAGFSEAGNAELEDEVKGIAEHHGISLLGPNVLGLINTENSMNASFASKMPEEGSISFMSQSGAFCTAILDYAKAEDIGFRHFVSMGNKAQLNEVDMLEHWQQDEGTETVIGYTEGIDNGREFLETARKVSEEKPVVMVKSGRSDEGGKAASSHTGSIAGSYQSYRAAFRQAGVIEAESSRELLDYGRALAYQELPEGKSIAVVTNAGGPGVITTDEIKEHGLELAELSGETREKLERALPGEAAAENPVDVIGDAGHDRYRDALDAVLEDEGVDAVVTILTPQANTEIEKTAKTVVKASREAEKPIMASFMGEKDVSSGVEILEEGNVPDFRDPMDAVKALAAMEGYREYRETEKTFRDVDVDEKAASDAVDSLPGFEARQQLFKAYGFTLPLSQVADTPKDAVDAAQSTGYPAVMKVEAPQIHHKTDMDGVRENLESKKEVRQAFNEIYDNVYHDLGGEEIDGMLVQEELEGLEVAVGMNRDPQFGPVVMVGLGGIYIEALNDVSFGVAPVSEEEAEAMIDELRSHELFEGVRGEEHSLEPVKDAIIQLGQLGLDHPEIQSVDINPLILKKDKAYAADIKVELE